MNIKTGWPSRETQEVRGVPNFLIFRGIEIAALNAQRDSCNASIDLVRFRVDLDIVSIGLVSRLFFYQLKSITTFPSL